MIVNKATEEEDGEEIITYDRKMARFFCCLYGC